MQKTNLARTTLALSKQTLLCLSKIKKVKGSTIGDTLEDSLEGYGSPKAVRKEKTSERKNLKWEFNEDYEELFLSYRKEIQEQKKETAERKTYQLNKEIIEQLNDLSSSYKVRREEIVDFFVGICFMESYGDLEVKALSLSLKERLFSKLYDQIEVQVEASEQEWGEYCKTLPMGFMDRNDLQISSEGDISQFLVTGDMISTDIDIAKREAHERLSIFEEGTQDAREQLRNLGREAQKLREEREKDPFYVLAKKLNSSDMTQEEILAELQQHMTSKDETDE